MWTVQFALSHNDAVTANKETLAALDEEIGEITFTVGERVDGVVKTGTEQAKTFLTEEFFFERDLRIARNLFAQGSFFASARLLRRHQTADAKRAHQIALCMHEWQRMSYAKAATHAATFSQGTCDHLKRMAAAGPFDVTILGDLLAGADELLRWGDAEEALARFYRAAEQTAKVRLADGHSVRPPYLISALLSILPPGCRLADDFRRSCRASGEILLTNQKAWEALAASQDPMADSYLADSRLQDGLRRRNESLYGHGRDPVDPAVVREVGNCLRNLLRQHLPAALACWSTARRPTTLL